MNHVNLLINKIKMAHTAVILAGGKSSRMGTDKGLIKINNLPMIRHIINTLKAGGIHEIIIIANNQEYKQFNLPVFTDIYPNKGPLGGIYTGLSISKTEKNIILSCDIPFVDMTTIKLLIKNANNVPITIIKHQNKNHPLIGVYSKNLINKIKEKLLQNELKLEKFVLENKHQIIDVDLYPLNFNKQITENINSIHELKKYNYEM